MTVEQIKTMIPFSFCETAQKNRSRLVQRYEVYNCEKGRVFVRYKDVFDDGKCKTPDFHIGEFAQAVRDKVFTLECDIDGDNTIFI